MTDEPEAAAAEVGTAGAGAAGAGAAQPTRVSSLELFFDLVFVFTITQLTGTLSRDLTVGGAVRVLLIFSVLWWMYGGYAWLTNVRTPRRLPERLLILLGMAGFLIIGLALPHAFSRRGEAVALGLGYLLVVVVHGALYLRLNRNIRRVVPFNLASAALVTAAGIFGIGAAGRPVTVALVTTSVLGLALAASLWWAYFGTGDDERAEETMTRADPAVRPRLALQAYYYAYIPMLLGIVALAAGVKRVIGAAGATSSYPACLALGGGVALYLAADAAFRHALRIGAPRYRIAAAVAALASTVVGVTLSVSAEIALLAVIVVAALAADTVDP